MVTLDPLPADDPRAIAVLTAYFDLRGAIFPAGQQYRPTFPGADAFTPPAGVFLVAVGADGTDLGCGGIRRIEDGPRGPRFEVKHLYVDPEARGQGIGRTLLEALESSARGWGAAELVLDTHHTLEAAARLYDAAGFEPTAPYNTNPNATRWYRKPLPPQG